MNQKRWECYAWMPVRWMGRQTGPTVRHHYSSHVTVTAPTRQAAIAAFMQTPEGKGNAGRSVSARRIS